MHANKLKLNGDKTEYLLIGNKHQKSKITPPEFQIAGSNISTSQQARNLGVIFDEELNMEAHISALCKSISFQLFKIGEIRKYLSVDTTATLVHSLITSRLDCANAILYGLPEKQLDRLQRIQNSAARLVVKVGKHEHIRPILTKLHWLPIRERIVFKILIMTFKILINRAPHYLQALIAERKTEGHALRSNECLLLDVPLILPARSQQAFSVAAPVLWNGLPRDLHLRQDIVVEKFTAFKRKVKTYLFKKAYGD